MSIAAGYVIIYSIIASLCYSVVVVLGYIKAYKTSKRDMYVTTVKSLLNEVKEFINYKEDKFMSKNYEARELENKSIDYGIERVTKKAPQNNLTLSDLLNNKPSEEQYAEVLSYLVKLAKETYKQYNFLIAKSNNEEEQANFLQITSGYHENPDLHKLIFSKSIDYGIDMGVLRDKFAQKVANGEVIPLGEDVKVVVDDRSGLPATAVSPINSGLGSEISFIISFLKEENYDDFIKYKEKEHKGTEAV